MAREPGEHWQISLTLLIRKLISERSRLVQYMLKRGITRSNDVLPSTVTSTTAQGFVPPFSGLGSIAASLSPLLVSPESAVYGTPVKSSDDGGALLTPIAEKRGENRPPPISNLRAESLEESFRNIVPLDHKHRSALPPHWNAT
jgi:hypothetical protein